LPFEKIACAQELLNRGFPVWGIHVASGVNARTFAGSRALLTRQRLRPHCSLLVNHIINAGADDGGSPQATLAKGMPINSAVCFAHARLCASHLNVRFARKSDMSVRSCPQI
jgi:hypothetical protein